VAVAGDILVGAASTRGSTTHVTLNRVERFGEFMTKQISIHGKRVQLLSFDEGRTWSSSPQSIVAYGQRKKLLRMDLQKRFSRIDDGMQDPDPNYIGAIEVPRNLIGR